jgi:hypothetical protein
MHQIHDANPANKSVFRAAVLSTHKFNKPRVTFVLDTVIGNQKSIGLSAIKPSTSSRDSAPSVVRFGENQ